MTMEHLHLKRSKISYRNNLRFLISVLTAFVANGFFQTNNVKAFNTAPVRGFQRLHVAYSSPYKSKHNRSFDLGVLFSHYLPSHSSSDDRKSHLEMQQNDENGDGSSSFNGGNAAAPEMTASSATTPKRIIKHKNRKTKTKAKMRRNSAAMKNGPLNEEELAMHVSSQYVAGPGGLFKQVDARRKRQEKASIFSNEENCNMEQVEYLKKLDRHPALVLNADYQPLSVLPLSLWSWQDTVKALFSGKVTVVETYTDINIRAVNMDVPLPSVIALTEYVSQPKQRPAFTRRNVFLRDGYRCQYCGKMFKTYDLSLDHVVPRCAGGKLEWDNTVTCCKKCNSKKGSTMPNNLRSIGMKLIREPRCPSKYELAAEAGKMVPRRVHPTWKPFLGIEDNDEDFDEDTSASSFDSRKYFDSS